MSEDLAGDLSLLWSMIDPAMLEELGRIDAPKASPCSPWCDVWRHDTDPRKWRTCTHRRRR